MMLNKVYDKTLEQGYYPARILSVTEVPEVINVYTDAVKSKGYIRVDLEVDNGTPVTDRIYSEISLDCVVSGLANQLRFNTFKQYTAGEVLEHSIGQLITVYLEPNSQYGNYQINYREEA